MPPAALESLYRAMPRPLRTFVKRRVERVYFAPKFHGGHLYVNAARHGSVWFLGPEEWDRPFQNALVALAASHDAFIDIGANIGILTLTVALRVPTVRRIIAFEPSLQALACLRRSIRRNNLSQRVQLVEGVVSDHDGTERFVNEEWMTGHISTSSNGKGSTSGDVVSAVDLRSLLNTELLRYPKVLVKMDVEGFEAQLLPLLVDVPERRRVTLVVEIHPNRDCPQTSFDALRASGATCETIEGAPAFPQTEGWQQVVARWAR